MRVYLDQAATGQSKAPRFRVELRNVGEKDLRLNLGITTRNGEQQYPTAVSLILADSQRLFQLIELRRSIPVSDVGKETLYLPLAVGATFSFPVDLDHYWAVNSKEIDYKLKPGTYWLAAHLNGFIRTGPPLFVALPVAGPGQPLHVSERTFDMVYDSDFAYPQTGFGPPPMSNALQFEVPSR